MAKRHLMLVNAGFRIGYGVGGLFVPSTMAKLRLTPDVSGRPDARLFVRGFSAHQIGVAALGLAGLRWRRLERPAAIAAVAIDVTDMLSAAVEASKRGELESDLAGGLVFSRPPESPPPPQRCDGPSRARWMADVLPDVLVPGLRVVFFCQAGSG